MTHEELLQELHYDPDTGIFTWRTRKQGRRNPAGSMHPAGYIHIHLGYKRYPAHVLAWWYVHGSYPDKHLDHINRNRSDNRIVNLRLADDSENQQNRGLNASNTSGYTGVTWNKAAKKWQAQIMHKGKYRNLGCYEDKLDAAMAYRLAKLHLHSFHPIATPQDLSVQSIAEKTYTPRFTKIMATPKSGYKGALEYTVGGETRYMASFRFKGKTYKLPGYETAEEASRAAEDYKERVESGILSVDDLCTGARVEIAGVSASKLTWSYAAGVHRSTLWRRAAENRTTFKDEVIKLLPKRPDGSVETRALFSDRPYKVSEAKPKPPQEFHVSLHEKRYEEVTYWYVVVTYKGEHIACLSGFSGKGAADEKAQEVRAGWKDGSLTLEDIRNMRKGVIGGVRKPIKEWAKILGVSTPAIYKEAKRNNRTPQEEVEARLKARDMLPKPDKM